MVAHGRSHESGVRAQIQPCMDIGADWMVRVSEGGGSGSFELSGSSSRVSEGLLYSGTIQCTCHGS